MKYLTALLLILWITVDCQIHLPKDSLRHQIANSLDSMGWFALWAGWFLYWLKELDTFNQGLKMRNLGVFRDFAMYKLFSFPASVLSIVVIAAISSEIPPTFMDTRGLASLLILGWSNSSFLNNLFNRKQRHEEAAKKP